MMQKLWSVFKLVVKCLVDFAKDELCLGSAYSNLILLQELKFEGQGRIEEICDRRWKFMENDTLLLGKFCD